jgi:HSP20 family molecular chaperone IbpA
MFCAITRPAPTVRRLVGTSTLTRFSLLNSDFLQRGVDGLPKLEEQENKYVISVKIPGIRKDELEIELVGRRSMVVSARTNAETISSSGSSDPQKPSEQPLSQPTTNSSLQEESTASFKIRTAINLPKDADIDTIKMSFADSVLRIEAAKKAANVTEQVDEETAAARAEFKRKRERWETLRRELKEAGENVVEAEAKLRKARVAKRQKIASERRQLSITL